MEEKIMAFSGATLEECEKEIETIFEDEQLLACMEAGLANVGNETSLDIMDKRGQWAIDAFERNPPEFWDMGKKDKL